MTMQDPRWNNPQQPPLSNGPLRAVTSPSELKFKLVNDGHYIEYLLPYPMHVVDSAQWKPLECFIEKKRVDIEKPVPIASPYEPQGRLGNESPDAFSSIVRVKCPSGIEPFPTVDEAWKLVESLLSWTRVKARHYWLLHGQAGFGAAYRGSLFVQATPQLSQENFAVYGPNLIVQPLTEGVWSTLASDLNSLSEPPVSESLFCDALLSVTAGDEIKAVLEMGVAMEIELSHLLDAIAQVQPGTPDKTEYAKRGNWEKFYDKLEDWPQRLGLEAASAFSTKGLPPDWINVAKELYNLRGSVAHSGKLRSGVSARHVIDYAFAANALFAYCRAQKIKTGLITYSYPPGQELHESIVMFRDGAFSCRSSPLVGAFT
jgi:hypothetical protein